MKRKRKGKLKKGKRRKGRKEGRRKKEEEIEEEKKKKREGKEKNLCSRPVRYYFFTKYAKHASVQASK